MLINSRIKIPLNFPNVPWATIALIFVDGVRFVVVFVFQIKQGLCFSRQPNYFTKIVLDESVQFVQKLSTSFFVSCKNMDSFSP